MDYSKLLFFFSLETFPPPPIALSVVSMEVFAPHKMAEIRARHSNEGVPELRIGTRTVNWEGAM